MFVTYREGTDAMWSRALGTLLALELCAGGVEPGANGAVAPRRLLLFCVRSPALRGFLARRRDTRTGDEDEGGGGEQGGGRGDQEARAPHALGETAESPLRRAFYAHLAGEDTPWAHRGRSPSTKVNVYGSLGWDRLSCGSDTFCRRRRTPTHTHARAHAQELAPCQPPSVTPYRSWPAHQGHTRTMCPPGGCCRCCT